MYLGIYNIYRLYITNYYIIISDIYIDIFQILIKKLLSNLIDIIHNIS